MRQITSLVLILSSFAVAQNPCTQASTALETVYDCPCGPNYPILNWALSTAIGTTGGLVMSDTTTTQPGSGWYFLGNASGANIPSGIIQCPDSTWVTTTWVNVTASQPITFTGPLAGMWPASSWLIAIPNNTALRGTRIYCVALTEIGTSGVYRSTPTIYITIT